MYPSSIFSLIPRLDWQAYLNEQWKVFNQLVMTKLQDNFSENLYVLYFRLKPLHTYVQSEHSIRFTALCTSSGIWLLTCHAEKEEEQHHAQQTTGLDDWASSALCCCSPEGQELLCFTWGNISARQAADQWPSVNSSQTWFPQVQYRQGKVFLYECLNLPEVMMTVPLVTNNNYFTS